MATVVRDAMAASTAPQCDLITIEDIQGPNGAVALVRFLVSELNPSERIQTIGGQLYGLVEGHGRARMLLNLGNVNLLLTEFLGKLLGLQKRVKLANGKLALCRLSPTVDEALEVCGLKSYFAIFADEATALETYF